MESTPEAPTLREQLLQRVRARTFNRLRNLEIRLSADGVLMFGQATSYHIKQLAQHGILEFLPKVQLYNAIDVS